MNYRKRKNELDMAQNLMFELLINLEKGDKIKIFNGDNAVFEESISDDIKPLLKTLITANIKQLSIFIAEVRKEMFKDEESK